MGPRALYESDDTSWLEKPDPSVEGPWVERKKSCDSAELARQVSAFANSSVEGGLIVVGVSKEGRLEGIATSAANKLLEDVRGRVDGTWEHRFVDLGGESKILYLYVPFSPDRVVCRSDRKAFKRYGGSTRELAEAELQELRYQRGELRFEDEPATRLSDEVIDGELADQYLGFLRRRNGLTEPLTFKEAIRNRRLAVERADGLHLTNAGVLVFAKDPMVWLGGARLRFLRFDGTTEEVGTKRNVVKDRWFEGPIPRIVPAFRAFMRDQVKEFDYLGSEGKFVTEPEYPQEAWEEAVVNALVHRSYSLRNEAAFVRMFDDRLEIESPGGFPVPLRPGEIPDRSHPRNPHLADALQCFELVRLAREGTKRMARTMAELNLPPPDFAELPGGQVQVTLRNDIERRRGRMGTGESKQGWAEVERLLESELLLYRRAALDEWREILNRGATTPPRIVDAAHRLMTEGRLGGALQQRLVEVLAKDSEAVERFALEFVMGPLSAHDVETLNNAVDIVARSEAAVNQLLDWLERHDPDLYRVPKRRDPEAGRKVEFALRVLLDRALRQPYPPEAWVQRVLSLCRSYPDAPGVAGAYESITGKPLVSKP